MIPGERVVLTVDMDADVLVVGARGTVVSVKEKTRPIVQFDAWNRPFKVWIYNLDPLNAIERLAELS